MAKLKQQTRWLSAAVVVTVLSLVLVFGLDGQAQAQMVAPQAPRPAQPIQFGPDVPRLAQAGGEQIFRGDLMVEPGRVIDGDVAVYSGDVQVEEGGQIQGNLVVYSGDLEIRPGGSVGGDVTTFSGNIEIAGRVGGNVASWSGDVDLASTARVEGGVSVLSGEIHREQGAYVGGSVAEGPQLRLPGAPGRDLPVPPRVPVQDRSGGFFGWIGQLFLRLIGAVLLTGVATLLAGVLAYAWPELVSRVRGQMNENLALSFVIGLLANLVLLFLAGLLSATICLLPIALVPILLLLGINLVGWAAVSQVAGERISAWVKQPVQPALATAVGAVALTGAMALLWAMGGCFRFVGFLAMLGIGSFGTGAVLLPWLSGRRTGGGPAVRTYTTGEPPAGPGRGPAPAAPSAPVAPSTSTTAETAQQPAASSVGTEGAALEDELAEPLDYVTAQDVLAAQAEEIRDDSFVRIKGIGPVFEQRLKNAGIRTFGELAIMPPERIAEIIGWPVERVLRSDINGQARYFSENR